MKPSRFLLCFFLSLPLLSQGVLGDVDGDGDVDLNDLAVIQSSIGATAGSGDPRDLDKDGRITVLDLRRAQGLCTRPGCAVEAASIRVDVSPAEVTLLVGQTANFSTSAVVTSSTNTTRVVALEQSVPSGLSVSPAITGSFTATGSFTQLDNQTVRANAIGTYMVTTTATSTGLPPVTGSLTVKVVAAIDPLQLSIPGTIPTALPPNASTSVLFSVVASGGPTPAVPTISVEGVGHSFLLTVTDDGGGADMNAGDLVYAASGTVNTTGMSPGQCLSFRAVSGATVSTPYQLCVSSLPEQPAPSDLGAIFTNGSTNVINNEVIVIVKTGVTEPQIQGLATSVGATVVGAIPILRMYQFRLGTVPANLAGLNAIVASLASSPLVETATTNDVGSTTAVTPNDPRWGSQYGPAKIRADEAWVIARGSTTIAVIDTGVDYNHPDLSGKVVLGYDYANGDTDPFDDGGHGTHVAGTAAAKSNNGVGVTGVAWNSPILAVKALKGVGGGVGAGVALSVAQSIVYAANRGVRVMNLSLGWPTLSWQVITCPAVAYARFARGAVVVTAAGNNSNSTPLYPAGCSGAFAVGSTTSTDGRSTFSNFGSYVQIAAPGTGILSTYPTALDATGYRTLSGTSMAAPHVAGAVAVMFSRRPTLSAAQVEGQLKRTAFPLAAALGLGAGRLDLFEAVFDGSFEDNLMSLWTRVGTASSIPNLGPLQPRDRKRMGFLSSGPAGDQVAGSLTQTFTVQPGVTSFPLSFEYAFVTEEWPEFVGTQFNDSMTVTLVTPSGGTVTLASETVNGSAFTAVGGINFPGGDSTTGWTGWKTKTVTVPTSAGPGTYRIFVTDAGDDIYDSAIVIDKIRFK